MRTTIAGLVAFGMIITACSVAETADSTTSTSEPATTSTSTTSTTLPPTTTLDESATSLINGLQVEDAELLDRRVVAVKIDNHPKANPQSGIEQADMVIELRVEGITRFITLWHESDSEFLGPNRSGRPTDPALLAALNEPTFVISGAQGWVQNVIRSKNVHLIKELSEGTFRIPERSAPHNLYVNTIVLRETADERGFPDNPPEGPLWKFGPMSASSEPANSVTIDFGSSDVVWDWDPESEGWLRTAYGKEGTYFDPEGYEQPLSVPVLIALYTEQYTYSPPAGESGSSLPSSEVIGSGKAFVFADGRVIEGTWERESETEWFTLTGADGESMLVPPGKSWLSLVPNTTGLTIDS
ncbi:MAG: DUF3048 domain-containing protein [Acidimicrobiia bacterium]